MAVKSQNKKTPACHIPYPVVMVEWVDAMGHDAGWFTKSEIGDFVKTGCPKMVSHGFLVCDDKDKIIIAGTIAGDIDAFGNILVIPRGIVTKIKKRKSHGGV